MNTVHLEPKSIGEVDFTAKDTNSSTFIPNDLASVSINEPHPDEHASLSIMLLTAPSLILIYFIS